MHYMDNLPWFERKFAFDLPLSMLPNIVERLRGTPARLEERLRSVPANLLVTRFDNKWSIQENVGHICDLETLWIKRAKQILLSESHLAVADLANRGTDEANHNAMPLEAIILRFRTSRARFVSLFELADASALHNTALHPRLGTPMRLIDVAFFTVEHDDHHLARISLLLQRTPPAQ